MSLRPHTVAAALSIALFAPAFAADVNIDELIIGSVRQPLRPIPGRRILTDAGLPVVEQVATMDDAARRAAELAAAAPTGA